MLISLNEHRHDPVLRVFSHMSDSELRDPKQLIGFCRATGIPVGSEGIFIAESRNVIERALNAGLKPFALISEQRWFEPHRDLFARIEKLNQRWAHFSIPWNSCRNRTAHWFQTNRRSHCRILSTNVNPAKRDTYQRTARCCFGRYHQLHQYRSNLSKRSCSRN